MDLVHDESYKKKHVTHDYRHMCPVLLCRCLRAVCLRCVSCHGFPGYKKKRVFSVVSGEVVKAMASKSVDTR